MKARYKYIHFERLTAKDSPHHAWAINNNKSLDTLAIVTWYEPWKQFVFQATPDCVFSVSCLQDIIAFIGELEKERKDGSAQAG